MGNRAVITTQDKQIGVYLHWNGGRDSVEAFLLYCKLKGYRAPENDCYGWARLCQVIGNFFGGDLSVGIDRYDKLDTDNGDNGVYIIKNWQIVGREFFNGEEQSVYDKLDVLNDIDECQPKNEQIGKENIQTELLKISTITTRQIRCIHTIIKKLGFSEERYKQILDSLFKVNSCKELSELQASVLIESLSKLMEIMRVE